MYFLLINYFRWAKYYDYITVKWDFFSYALYHKIILINNASSFIEYSKMNDLDPLNKWMCILEGGPKY